MLLFRMAKLVQIRDVPDEVHRTLKSRAAAAGMSLSEYLRAQLARAASRLTPEELSAHLDARGGAPLRTPSERLVRRLRDRGE